MNGWLIRCRPETGTFTASLGPAALHQTEDGVEAVAAGDFDVREVIGQLLKQSEPKSPSGVVAAARWDSRRRRLDLIRDRTGLHPLFETRTRDNEVVASTDLRRLLSEPGVAVGASRSALGAWLLSAPLAMDETLLAGIRRVPAGHILEIGADGQYLRQDWVSPEPSTHDGKMAKRFGEILEAAVERYSTLGRLSVFLSGGLDSSAVAAAAAAVSRRSGHEMPLALCVDFPEASEQATQTRVAQALFLIRLDAIALAEQHLFGQAMVRAGESLWPTQALWAPVFDTLSDRGRQAGARVLLDGQGGDDLLDAGYEAGRELLASPVGLANWLRAERRYTGGIIPSLRALLPRRAVPPSLPPWLAHDLRDSVLERFHATPRRYGAVRTADAVDAELAAQREETFDRGTRTGLVQRHPLWDAGVVALLNGLPPSALVAHGHPKSPARAYLRAQVPQIVGPWPKPMRADSLANALSNTLRAHAKQNGFPNLAAHGVILENRTTHPQNHQIWRMMCLERWVNALVHRGESA